jgi:hypothetical protein
MNFQFPFFNFRSMIKFQSANIETLSIGNSMEIDI